MLPGEIAIIYASGTCITSKSRVSTTAQDQKQVWLTKINPRDSSTDVQNFHPDDADTSPALPLVASGALGAAKPASFLCLFSSPALPSPAVCSPALPRAFSLPPAGPTLLAWSIALRLGGADLLLTRRELAKLGTRAVPVVRVELGTVPGGGTCRYSLFREERRVGGDGEASGGGMGEGDESDRDEEDEEDGRGGDEQGWMMMDGTESSGSEDEGRAELGTEVGVPSAESWE